MTISAAISIVKDISNRDYFNSKLLSKITKDLNNANEYIKASNNVVEKNKQNLLNALISRSDAKTASEKEVELVNATCEKDYYELVDPINAAEVIAKLKKEDTELKANILSAIKISNATTIIEI